jgi:hypothetical protein
VARHLEQPPSPAPKKATRNVIQTTPIGTFALDGQGALVRLEGDVVAAAMDMSAKWTGFEVHPSGSPVVAWSGRQVAVADGQLLNQVALASLTRVDGAIISPNGEQVAFLRNYGGPASEVLVYRAPSLRLVGTYRTQYAAFSEDSQLCIGKSDSYVPAPGAAELNTRPGAFSLCIPGERVVVRQFPKSTMRLLARTVVVDDESGLAAGFEVRPIDDPPPHEQEPGCGADELPPRITRVVVASEEGHATVHLNLGRIVPWELGLRFAERGRVLEVCTGADGPGRFDTQTGEPLGPCQGL